MNQAARPLDELATAIAARAGAVESSLEAAAHLEAMGILDSDAQRQFGYEDVFELADAVTALQRSGGDIEAVAWSTEATRRAEQREELSPPSLLAAIPRFFIRGAAFALPMVIMVFAILILLYSLWAYYYFDSPTGTAIGVGTALSYFLAGGFTQAIGRRGLMYVHQQQYLLALKVSALFVALGTLATLVVAGALWFFFASFPVLTGVDRNLVLLYFTTLSLLWYSLAVLYMLQQELWFSVAVAAGIGIVMVLRENLGWPIVAAHQAGILGAAALSLTVSTCLLVWNHRRHRSDGNRRSAPLPRLTVLGAAVAPYFLFGLLYFGLVFGDRVLAWTGRMEFRESFISFRTDYEVGLNWALLGLVPALGVLEFAVHRFSAAVRPVAMDYALTEVRQFRARFASSFRAQLLAFVVAATVGPVGAYFLMVRLVAQIPEIAVLLNDVSVRVFAIASVGYGLIALGLLNTALHFWLSRPRMAILAVLPALAVDFSVGFVASRSIGYWAASFGLLAGGATFAALSLLSTIRVLRRLDYYYYSAF